MVMTKDPQTVRRERGFVALLLITAALLLLAGRAVPTLGSGVALVLGLELLVWAVLARSSGLLTIGGVLIGVGTGVLLAGGPLKGMAPHVVGGVYMLSLATGFAVVGLLSWRPLHLPQLWPWLAAGVTGLLGAALLTGPDHVATVVGWALPVLLLMAGIVVAIRRSPRTESPGRDAKTRTEQTP
jgi:hypothetical protein